MADARIQNGPSLSHAVDDQLVPVHLIDSSSDSKTGITSPTLKVSKNGGTLATPSDGTWAEVGTGIYTIRLDKTDTENLGWVALTVTHASAEDVVVFCEIGINSNEQRSGYIRQRAMYRG